MKQALGFLLGLVCSACSFPQYGGFQSSDGGAEDGSVNPCSTVGACLPDAATCADQSKNGNETDVDCGGSCSPCTMGQGCAANSDCTTGSCVNALCVSPPQTGCKT